MKLNKRAVFFYILLMAIGLLLAGGAISEAFYATDYDFFIWIILALFIWNGTNSIALYHYIHELYLARESNFNLHEELEKSSISLREHHRLIRENKKLKTKLKKLKHSNKDAFAIKG